MPKQSQKIFRIRLAVISAVVLVLQLFGPLVQQAQAVAILTTVQVRFNRMIQSTGGAGDVFTDGTVCAGVLGASGTETAVVVTFPTGMTVSSTLANWTTNGTSNSAWPGGASAWPITSSAAATSVSGQAVTWNTSNITTDGVYCFNWTNTTAALKTNTTVANSQSGSVATTVSAGVTSSGNFATATISNDQVVITAIVPQTFTFSLSANSDAFTANLSTSSVQRTTGITANVSTNAINGWIVWARDSIATCPGAGCGLKSVTANYTIGWTNVASNTTISGDGNEHYITGVHVTTAGNTSPATATTVAATATYEGTSVGSSQGAGLDATLRQIATANGTTNGSVVNIQEKAAVNAATPAATDYSDTVTIVAAASF